MSLNRKQIEAVRQATGQLRLELSHVRGWDEQLVKDYLAWLNALAQRMDQHSEEAAERIKRRLRNLLGVRPEASPIVALLVDDPPLTTMSGDRREEAVVIRRDVPLR